jgi:hypothetical protein
VQRQHGHTQKGCVGGRDWSGEGGIEWGCGLEGDGPEQILKGFSCKELDVGAEVVAQVVEHLPRKLEAISSSLSTTKKRLGRARLSWGT